MKKTSNENKKENKKENKNIEKINNKEEIIILSNNEKNDNELEKDGEGDEEQEEEIETIPEEQNIILFFGDGEPLKKSHQKIVQTDSKLKDRVKHKTLNKIFFFLVSYTFSKFI
jgi:hypothetical protein